MARAMSTVASERFRAVVSFRKIAPDVDEAYRNRFRERAKVNHPYSDLDYWEKKWAEDTASVGQVTEQIIGHYDTIAPVKQALNKEIKRKANNYAVESIQFQRAPLVWEDCDDRGK